MIQSIKPIRPPPPPLLPSPKEQAHLAKFPHPQPKDSPAAAHKAAPGIFEDFEKAREDESTTPRTYYEQKIPEIKAPPPRGVVKLPSAKTPPLPAVPATSPPFSAFSSIVGVSQRQVVFANALSPSMPITCGLKFFSRNTTEDGFNKIKLSRCVNNPDREAQPRYLDLQNTADTDADVCMQTEYFKQDVGLHDPQPPPIHEAPANLNINEMD